MQDDPQQYWRDLTELYRQMSDGELRELAASPDDLTEVARQVLRDEIKKRRLDETRPSRATPSFSTGPEVPRDHRTVAHFTPSEELAETAGTFGDGEIPPEYTWKTVLCECDTREQAWQISQVLTQAGIESWIEAPRQYYVDPSNPKVMVAADQLEAARQVAARPIPQEIIDASMIKLPEFVPPECPRCGAEDPMLESADPLNSWLCEACGAEWTDPEPTASTGDYEKPYASRLGPPETGC